MKKTIQIIWSTDDVLNVRPDLTDKQANEVLDNLKKHHDAEIGINWEVIDTVAGILFPKPE